MGLGKTFLTLLFVNFTALYQHQPWHKKASTLTLNEERDTLSLRAMMPAHEVKIVELELRDEEAAEGPWMHAVFGACPKWCDVHGGAAGLPLFRNQHRAREGKPASKTL